jgi:hypothetical protein
VSKPTFSTPLPAVPRSIGRLAGRAALPPARSPDPWTHVAMERSDTALPAPPPTQPRATSERPVTPAIVGRPEPAGLADAPPTTGNDRALQVGPERESVIPVALARTRVPVPASDQSIASSPLSPPPLASHPGSAAPASRAPARNPRARDSATDSRTVLERVKPHSVRTLPPESDEPALDPLPLHGHAIPPADVAARAPASATAPEHPTSELPTERAVLPSSPAVHIGRIEVVVAPPEPAIDPFAGCHALEAATGAPRGGGW